MSDFLRQPLLAAKTTDEQLAAFKYPGFLSPKIDGIRALSSDSRLLSRTMKAIPNRHTRAVFSTTALHGFDGELVVGNAWDSNLMQQTSSGVMTILGKPEVCYHVFDLWNRPDLRYDERYSILMDRCLTLQMAGFSGKLAMVPQLIVKSHEELLEWESQFIAKGYEGAMLRSIDGLYKQGRSTVREGILLKVKRFHDGEAEILSCSPLMRNYNEPDKDERGYTKRSSVQANKVADELLGSITVRCCESGQVFDVGTGFSDAQRISFWDDRKRLPGHIIKFKSFTATGVKDKPRFPVFLGFRSPLDI